MQCGLILRKLWTHPREVKKSLQVQKNFWAIFTIIQRLFITNNIYNFLWYWLVLHYVVIIIYEESFMNDYWELLFLPPTNSNRAKRYWHRAPTISKNAWYLGESPWKVFEFNFFPEKPLNFCASPWKVFEFSSTLNAVSWKVFLMFFGCSRQNVNHSSEKRWFSWHVFLFYATLLTINLRQVS